MQEIGHSSLKLLIDKFQTKLGKKGLNLAKEIKKTQSQTTLCAFKIGYSSLL